MAIRKPGPYAPLSAHYADDERIIEAGEDAELLYCRMLAYAARTPLTEGWIPESVVLTRLGFDDSKERVERLMSTGLIDLDSEGYQIVSWLRWNRSAEEMGKERGRDRTRKARDQGLSGNSAGNEPGKGAGKGDEFPPDFPLSNQNTNQINTHAARGNASDLDTDPDFAAFWAAYPRRSDKGHARKAWKAKVVKGTVEPGLVIQAAQSFALQAKNTEPRFIPMPATWLNGERWDDERMPATHLDEHGLPPRPTGVTTWN